MLGKRIVTVFGAAVSAVAISACGSGAHARFSDNLGPGYVQLGNLHYQIQISRQLNAWNQDEDRWYLAGLTQTQLVLPRTEEWFGVSLQVFNWSHQAATPTSRFFISDTLGERFVPLANPSPNPYTYVPQSIPPGQQLPSTSSAAFAGWTQGEILIFKIPYASLVNRPFVLHIVSPTDSSQESVIELDV